MSESQECLSRYNNERINLEILAEEAAEIIHIKSKCIRFGLDDFHPKNGAVNRVALGREIGNLMAMVDLLIENGTIDHADVVFGMNEKKEKLKTWYHSTDK